MFDWKKPTVEMLGRWQPWHDGHTELFKRALAKTGQVCIMYRDVGGAHAGVEGQDDNPFQFEEVKKNIIAGLAPHGFEEGNQYVVSKFQILLIFLMGEVSVIHLQSMTWAKKYIKFLLQT